MPETETEMYLSVRRCSMDRRKTEKLKLKTDTVNGKSEKNMKII